MTSGDLQALIAKTGTFEERLEAAGHAGAHSWLFAVREVLYDFQRLERILDEALDLSDLEAGPAKLSAFADTVLYDVIPHVRGHMEDLEHDLDEVLPAKRGGDAEGGA
jgi:hypothetical protein